MRIEIPARRYRVISITPLVDIVLILLFFFMLASTYLDWRSLTLKLVSGEGATPDPEQVISVEVGAGPRIAIDGRTIPPEALGRQVRSRLTRSPRATVLVAPGDGVGVQQVVGVLDTLAAAGARAVALSGR